MIFGSGAFNTVPGMTLYDPVTGLYGGIQNPEEENVSNFNPYRRQWFYKPEYPTKTKRSVINLHAAINPLKGLTIKGAFSYNYWERNVEHHLTDRDLFRFTFDKPVLIRKGWCVRTSADITIRILSGHPNLPPTIISTSANSTPLSFCRHEPGI